MLPCLSYGQTPASSITNKLHLPLFAWPVYGVCMCMMRVCRPYECVSVVGSHFPSRFVLRPLCYPIDSRLFSVCVSILAEVNGSCSLPLVSVCVPRTGYRRRRHVYTIYFHHHHHHRHHAIVVVWKHCPNICCSWRSSLSGRGACQGGGESRYTGSGRCST